MTSFRIRSHVTPILVLFGAALTAACGGDSDDDGDKNGDEKCEENNADGTVTDPWTGYCTATFTEDYEVIDVFGDVDFTAKTGETYLVASYESVFGDEAKLYFLTDVGPDTFEVMPSDGSFPFTSNCEAESATRQYAVFADVTVYDTEDLDTVICELSSGLVVPSTGVSGFSATDFNLNGPNIYEIFLSGFSSECGGAENGFVSVPETCVRGSTTWLVPLQVIYAPADPL